MCSSCESECAVLEEVFVQFWTKSMCSAALTLIDFSPEAVLERFFGLLQLLLVLEAV